MASKGTYVWIFVLFVVILLSCCFVFWIFSWYGVIYPGRGRDRGSYRETPKYVERPEPSAPRREPPAPSAVTFASYEKIKNGMSYEDVAAAFGREGKAKGSRWIGKTELKVYEWRNADGSFATVDFARGRVCRKHQRGLK